jgi:glycosyltransferase domain-containing protein
MSYLNGIPCPFKILIADGGRDSDIQTTLENYDNYPNISYEYIRYPYDETLTEFHNKLEDVTKRVRTPYAMMADNDDQIVMEGVYKSIEFLENNPDYCCSRGNIISYRAGNFSGRGINLYSDYPEDVTGSTAQERLLNICTHFHSSWHNVIRTNYLLATFKLLKIANSSDFRFSGQFPGFFIALWGNEHREDYEFLMHGGGSPRIVPDPPPQNDWIRQKGWVKNFAYLSEMVSVGLSAVDGIDIAVARDLFCDYYYMLYTPRVPDHLDDLEQNIKASKSLNKSNEELTPLVEEIRGLIT